MSTMQVTEKFDWLGELEKTVTHSLFTTFGLDPMLFQDKQGGNVDTIHNVRQGIWATEQAEQVYRERGDYNSHAYHSHKDYIKHGKKDKKLQEQGELVDGYTGKTLNNQKGVRHLDHIVSAKEVHDDAGRVLAGLKGEDLANTDSNLQSTYWAINNAKKQHSMEKFVHEIAPQQLENRKQRMQKRQEKLELMQEDTPEQRHARNRLEAEIKADQEYIQALESMDKEKMIEMDKKARQEYDSKIANTYYTSSKFLMNTGIDAVSTGLKMGYRQTFGLVLAETWFDLKFILPKVLYKCRHDFSMDNFIVQIKEAFDNIFENTKKRLQKAIANFKDSFLGGVLSSISTTIINIFFTTSKLIGRLIRESWQNLVQIAKLMFFNPDRLSHGELMREITRLILVSISTIIGVIINQHLTTLFTFPLGIELANFLSALLTGILMVGCAYFIDYSPMMQKVWAFLDNLKDKYDILLEHLQQANAELDQYLMELTKIEFNLNTKQLQSFADSLAITANEYQKSIVIQAEVEKRNIELPFEMGNSQSTMAWLNGLKPKN